MFVIFLKNNFKTLPDKHLYQLFGLITGMNVLADVIIETLRNKDGTDHDGEIIIKCSLCMRRYRGELPKQGLRFPRNLKITTLR